MQLSRIYSNELHRTNPAVSSTPQHRLETDRRYRSYDYAYIVLCQQDIVFPWSHQALNQVCGIALDTDHLLHLSHIIQSKRMVTTYNILVLPGDGIGPEVMTEAVKVLKVFENEHRKFNLRQELIGGCSIDAHGKSVTEEVKKAALESDAVLFAAVGGPKWDHIRRGLDGPEGGLLQLRKAMDIYANLRPCSASSPSASIAKEFSPFRQEVIEGVDFVVVRENCGGAYFGKKIEEEDYGTSFLTSSMLSRLTVLFQRWTNGAIASARSSASPASRRKLPSVTTPPGPSSPWTKPMCSPRRGSGGASLKRP